MERATNAEVAANRAEIPQHLRETRDCQGRRRKYRVGWLAVIGGAVVVLAGCGAAPRSAEPARDSASGRVSHGAGAVPATGYCAVARTVAWATAPLPPTVTAGMVDNRMQATHDLADVAPPDLQDDLRIVLVGYEQFLDAENGDISSDQTVAVNSPGFVHALSAIDGYDRAACDVSAPAAISGTPR